MNIADLYRHIAGGEDSTHQFKADVKNEKSLAAEMVAFANANGGTIYIGVADDGSPTGLTKRDERRINQLISNAASQGVRSPLTVPTENVLLENGRTVIVLNVPEGIDKPYFDTDGVIWLKTGSDKRRVNAKEELQRIFQGTAQIPRRCNCPPGPGSISWINYDFGISCAMSIILSTRTIRQNSNGSSKI